MEGRDVVGVGGCAPPPPIHTVFVLGKQGKGAEWKKQSFSSLASAVYNRLA